jgi:hypothetical protein
MAKKSNDTFSPEMLRILKIFGIGSLVFVLIMSFFNERRANNSGKEESPMRITDADRLYFKNVRAAYYDIEDRKDAKMTIYRHGKRAKTEEVVSVGLSILLNRVKDEAYIFVEYTSEALPLKIRWSNLEEKNREGELVFEGGDKYSHFAFVEELYPLLLENTILELWHEGKYVPILEGEVDKDALRITIIDYYKLINNPK